MSDFESLKDRLPVYEPTPGCTPDEQATLVIQWVRSMFDVYERGVFDPIEAVDKRRGNCVASTLLCMTGMERSDIRTGLIFDGEHATFTFKSGDEVRFGDPFNIEIKKALSGNSQNFITSRVATLTRIHQETLPAEIGAGYCNRYFYFDMHDGTWKTSQLFIPDHDFVDTSGAHLVADPERGLDMLLAIGDVQKLIADKPEGFEELLEDKKHDLPDLALFQNLN